MRLAIVTSHPIQYHAPLFRELARRIDLTVFFAHRATPIDQANAGFGVEFDWDIDLLSGYEHRFLSNVATSPNLEQLLRAATRRRYGAAGRRSLRRGARDGMAPKKLRSSDYRGEASRHSDFGARAIVICRRLVRC